MAIQLTVSIPTYNRSALLAQAIESVLSQTFNKLQIMVCDNASTDDTRDIVCSFHDHRIIYHRHPENIGSHRNWRFALGRPETPYVALLSDDDLFLPEHAERGVNALQHYESAAFYACATEHFGDGRSWLHRPWWLEDAKEEIVVDPRTRYAAWLQGNPIASCSLVIRRSALNTITCWRGRWTESADYLWWGQLAMNGSFVFDPAVGTRYRWHRGNASHAWHTNAPLVASDVRYTIRTLANLAYMKGLVTEDSLVAEATQWPVTPVSTLVVALSSPAAALQLQHAARRLYSSRADLRSAQGASGHTKLAGHIGAWYLRFADRLDQLRASWSPNK